MFSCHSSGVLAKGVDSGNSQDYENCDMAEALPFTASENDALMATGAARAEMSFAAYIAIFLLLCTMLSLVFGFVFCQPALLWLPQKVVDTIFGKRRDESDDSKTLAIADEMTDGVDPKTGLRVRPGQMTAGLHAASGMWDEDARRCFCIEERSVAYMRGWERADMGWVGL